MSRRRPSPALDDIVRRLVDLSMEGLEHMFRQQMAGNRPTAAPRRGRTGPQGPDPYQVLGVAPGDPPALVHDVYRAKARHWHPDNKQTGDAGRFKLLAAAYSVVKELEEGRDGHER